MKCSQDLAELGNYLDTSIMTLNQIFFRAQFRVTAPLVWQPKHVDSPTMKRRPPGSYLSSAVARPGWPMGTLKNYDGSWVEWSHVARDDARRARRGPGPGHLLALVSAGAVRQPAERAKRRARALGDRRGAQQRNPKVPRRLRHR